MKKRSGNIAIWLTLIQFGYMIITTTIEIVMFPWNHKFNVQYKMLERYAIFTICIVILVEAIYALVKRDKRWIKLSICLTLNLVLLVSWVKSICKF